MRTLDPHFLSAFHQHNQSLIKSMSASKAPHHVGSNALRLSKKQTQTLNAYVPVKGLPKVEGIEAKYVETFAYHGPGSNSYRPPCD